MPFPLVSECRAPRIFALERLVELVHARELVAAVAWLAPQEAQVDEREHDVADIGGGSHPPVLQDEPRHHAEALEREIAASEGKLASANVTPLVQSLLAILERREHEEICTFIEPRFAQANAVHDPVAEGKL